MTDRLAALEQAIGITFRDRKLLQTAFMHRSLFNEQPHLLRDLTDNERLEFLGDAVLQFVTTTWLFASFPDQNEATLTHWRAALVSTKGLAECAARLDLGQYAYLSRGEDTPVGRKRPNLLADLFEALIGAIYLDQGLETARDFIIPFLRDRIDAIRRMLLDPTTRLQEKIQARHKKLPSYRLVEARGPEHQREYVMAVQVEGMEFTGAGPSKKEAKKAAARAALMALEDVL
ncbi:ribonuclease III [Chloroflexus sp.]|uniref:ribonuclease III n=1 Tax=Chloroflexus sp. TaxID=1904827 RepID=UPI00263175E5|nr:ribonuclease III [uncultured Chloroflexus sp.]